MRKHTFSSSRPAIAVAGAILFATTPAIAEDAAGPDKVKVGVFPISSSLPYFVARDLGYFKNLNLEPETSVLMAGRRTWRR